MDAPADPRVSVVFIARTPPQVLVTEFVQYMGTSCAVRLSKAGVEVTDGEAVVLDFEDPGLPLVRGRVERVDGRLLETRIVGFHQRDKREFPRVQAGLDLSFRPAPGDGDASLFEAWVERGEHSARETPPTQPDPFMDLSAAGFGFECEAPPRAGDHLFVTFSLPEHEEAFRGVARVIRVEAREDSPAHRVAVELTHATSDARQALMEKTIELLRLPGEYARYSG